MIEIFVILLAVSLFIIGGMAFFVVKYYWGPGGRPGSSSKSRKARGGRGGRG